MIKTVIEENIDENILETSIYSVAGLFTEERKGKIVDLTSVISAGKPVEFVDNNSNHTRTYANETYRVTDDAHDLESSFSLTGKVDEIMPTLSIPSGDFGAGVYNTVEIKTPHGVSEFTYSIKDDNYNPSCYTFTGTVTGMAYNVTKKVPLLRNLYHPNKANGEYADISRAIYILLFRCLNIPFRQAQNEEDGFKRLIKDLKFK